jgi:hypothetical protein
MLAVQPAAGVASQGNNPGDLQGVPAWRRSASMFATSEFIELTAESVTHDRTAATELSTL